MGHERPTPGSIIDWNPERILERERMHVVFGLSDRELENERRFGYAVFWMEGNPEWCDHEVEEPSDGRCNGLRTVFFNPGFAISTPRIIEDSGTWLLMKEYPGPAEAICLEAENGAAVKTPGACPFCEAKPGENHGYIYIGESSICIYGRAGEGVRAALNENSITRVLGDDLTDRILSHLPDDENGLVATALYIDEITVALSKVRRAIEATLQRVLVAKILEK